MGVPPPAFGEKVPKSTGRTAQTTGRIQSQSLTIGNQPTIHGFFLDRSISVWTTPSLNLVKYYFVRKIPESHHQKILDRLAFFFRFKESNVFGQLSLFLPLPLPVYISFLMSLVQSLWQDVIAVHGPSSPQLGRTIHAFIRQWKKSHRQTDIDERDDGLLRHMCPEPG